MARGRSPSPKTRILVWGRAADRCQYHGCGKRLDGDLVTGDLAKNHAYLAHIIASDPGGERGSEGGARRSTRPCWCSSAAARPCACPPPPR